MKRTKALRRRCDLPACGKLYRYSDPRSRTCSSICRKRLYLERKEAADQVAQEQNQAKADRRAAAMIEQTAERERQVLANRQSAPAPRPRTAPRTPAPTPWPYTHISRPEPKPQTVIIPDGRRMGRRATPL
jgi:hypothetical protein